MRLRPHLVPTALLALGLATTTALAAPNCAEGNKVSPAGRTRSLSIVGLTPDGGLVCFSAGRPGNATPIGTVTGLGGPDPRLVGIDFRVQDGKLYGVTRDGGVYTIDASTAAATLIGILTVPLEGTAFGVDFNPAADRLRIVSDTGQNLRHNVNAGGVTLEDADLVYTPPTAATGITGAAYVNNDLDPKTGTTLFDLDTNLDQIALQSPPNNGTLVATGKLGVDAGAQAGFDVFSAPIGGVTASNHGFAALTVSGVSALYGIDLLTGTATLVRPFAAPLVDIAIPLAVS
jgi:hypothetical protein